MSRVALCLPALDLGDALSHFTVLVAQALTRLGWQAEILAPVVHAEMLRHGRRAATLPDDFGPQDRVLLVHSMASPWTAQVADCPAPTVLLYTGLTPPELCMPHAPHLAAPLGQARADLAALAPHLAGALCTSQTSAEELAEITDCAVPTEIVPLVIDETLYGVPRRRSGTADAENRPPAGQRDNPRASGRLLLVGRVVPNKRVEDALAVHALLKRTGLPDAELDIVGDLTLCPDYVAWLQALSTDSPGPPPRWWGKVPFETLLERYRAADALLFLSAHEGFGVPLLEAMWLGVPIVAVACPGTVETLGPAGLIAAHRHHAALAELVGILLGDESLRARLIDAGRRRARHFAAETLVERLRGAWEQVSRRA